MDIHRLKPVHGWREFLKEYGIIVLGVLTALAGEQAVENIHYRREMREAREALTVEIESNMWSVDDRLKVSACIARRLDELDRWIDSQRTARPLMLAQPIAGPTSQIPGTSVWRIATAGVVGKMPFRNRVDYARFYDTLSTIDGITERMADRWRALAEVSDGHQLADADLYRARGYVRLLRSNNALMASDARVLLADGASMGLRPRNGAAYVPELLERQRVFCRPIVAGPAAATT